MNTLQHTEAEVGTADMLDDYCRWRLEHAVDEILYSKDKPENSDSNFTGNTPSFTRFIQSSFCQVIAILGSFYIICLIFLSLPVLCAKDYGLMNAHMFRLVRVNDANLSNRSCLKDEMEINIQFFHGCCALIGGLSWRGLDSNNSVRFDSKISANNLKLLVAGLSGSFIIQGSIDGVTRKSVASSDYRATHRGIRFLDSFRTSTPTLVSIDHRPPWPLLLEALSHVLVAVGVFCIACCGIFGKVLPAQQLAAALCCLKMLAEAVGACGYGSLGLYRQAFYAACQNVSWEMVAALLKFCRTGAGPAPTALGTARVPSKASGDRLAFKGRVYLAGDPPSHGDARRSGGAGPVAREGT